MRKLLNWWQARIDRERLARLDAHTLRDIGLEAWNSEIGQHADRYRERTLMRLAAMRFGAY